MNEPSNRAESQPPELSLRESARVREIDRQLGSLRLRQRGLKWVGIPALGGMHLLLAERLISNGSLTATTMVAFGLALAVAGGTGLNGLRIIRQRAEGLQDERSALTALPNRAVAAAD